jgi:hypothetical protein
MRRFEAAGNQSTFIPGSKNNMKKKFGLLALATTLSIAVQAQITQPALPPGKLVYTTGRTAAQALVSPWSTTWLLIDQRTAETRNA